MRLVITGSRGTIGRKLMAAFPDAVGIDRQSDADIVCDLAEIAPDASQLQDALRGVDAVIHLATCPNPGAPDAEHYEAVRATATLVAACSLAGVPRLVLPSSDWAEPKAPGLRVNMYGHSKRVIEAMAAMYSHTPGRHAIALRIGWVPVDPAFLEVAPAWLLANHWDDATLLTAFRTALAQTEV